MEQIINNTMLTGEIIVHIADLLKKVENSPRLEKYQYIIQIYDCLKSNIKFVTEHHQFYLTLKKNAFDLIGQIKPLLNSLEISDEEKNDMARTTYSIITCIHTIQTIHTI